MRVAVATALGTLPSAQSLPRLTVMLQDTDQRVIAAVLSALASSKATGVERVLLERLERRGLLGAGGRGERAGGSEGRGRGPAAGRGLPPRHH